MDHQEIKLKNESKELTNELEKMLYRIQVFKKMIL